MTERQQAVIDEAKARLGEIRPVRGQAWEDCFTEINGKPAVWFDKDIGQERPTTGVFVEGSYHGRAA